MRHQRTAGAVALASAVLLAVSACGEGGGGDTAGGGGDSLGDRAAGSSGPAPEGDPVEGGTVTFAYAVDAASVDSANCGSSVSWMACTAIYGTLVTFDPVTLEYGPGLAESYETEDGRVWTLTLREGLEFTDGTPLDAEAVAFNWERAKDPVNRNTAAATANQMQWSVTDPLTLEVALPEPDYQFPSLLYTALGVIGSPTAIRDRGPDFAANPVGAGPFTMEGWARGSEMTLQRNDGYWDAPRPYVDTLVIKTIPQEQQRLNALKSGDIDIDATSSQDMVDQLLSEGTSETHLTNLTGAGMRFSAENGAPADQRIREAIAHAVDTDAIREAVYGTEAGPRTFGLADSALEDPEATLPDHDPERAQQLVDEYLEETGESEVVINYLTFAGISQTVQESQMLQAQINAIDGLRFEIDETDVINRTMRIRRGEFEAAMDTMGASTDPAFLYDRIHSSGGENGARYSNPEVDRLLDEARAESEPTAAVDKIKEAIRVYVGDVPVVPWTNTVQYWFHNGSIGGIQGGYTYYPRPDLLWKE